MGRTLTATFTLLSDILSSDQPPGRRTHKKPLHHRRRRPGARGSASEQVFIGIPRMSPAGRGKKKNSRAKKAHPGPEQRPLYGYVWTTNPSAAPVAIIICVQAGAEPSAGAAASPSLPFLLLFLDSGWLSPYQDIAMPPTGHQGSSHHQGAHHDPSGVSYPLQSAAYYRKWHLHPCQVAIYR